VVDVSMKTNDLGKAVARHWASGIS